MLHLDMLTVSCNEPGFDAAALTDEEREFGVGLLELTVRAVNEVSGP